MFDTIYSVLPIVMIAAVAGVLFVKDRNRWNWLVWATLVSYYTSYIVLQEMMGTNSPSLQSLFLAVSVGTATALCALRTKTIWPLLVSLLMLCSGMMDFAHYVTLTISGQPDWNRGYQDAGAIVYYLALCIVMLHPSIKPLEKRRVKTWRYA